MHLSHDRPDYAYALRAADGQRAKVNDRVLTASFAIAPNQLLENWAVTDARALTAQDLEPLLAMAPSVLILGTGSQQIFPPAAIMAHCLAQGIGIEVMNNTAAARTYNVLASEARRVVTALIIPA